MRILISAIQYAPQLIGAGKYTTEMAEWLALQGHEIRVITAPHYYPQWKVADGYSAIWYQRSSQVVSTADGDKAIQIWRCPIWVPKRPTGLRRLLHLASFALSSLPLMLAQASWSPDVVILIEPTLMCAPHVFLLRVLSGAKTWLHVQDFEVDAAFELGQLQSSRARHLAARLEHFAMRSFDRVSTISQKMLHRLEQKGVAPGRRIFFPNWVDCEVIRPTPSSAQKRRELGLPEKGTIALYAGNLGEKQGLGLLANVARHLRGRENIKFVICGDGSFRSKLANMVSDLKNVHLLPLQPADRLNDLLNAADIHMLPQRSCAADLVMPSKLNGMLASGRPVVATAVPGTELAEVVSRFGRVVPPDNVAAMAQAIVVLAENRRLREELGASARQYALRSLDREPILQVFAKELEILYRGKESPLPQNVRDPAFAPTSGKAVAGGD